MPNTIVSPSVHVQSITAQLTLNIGNALFWLDNLKPAMMAFSPAGKLREQRNLDGLLGCHLARRFLVVASSLLEAWRVSICQANGDRFLHSSVQVGLRPLLEANPIDERELLWVESN